MFRKLTRPAPRSRSSRPCAARRRRLFAELLESRCLLAGDLQLASNYIYEQLPIESLVGDLNVVGAAGGETFTFELVAGAGGDGNASFQIDGNQLVTAETFDDSVQDEYSVRLRASGNLGTEIEASFVIDVLDTDGEYFDVLGTSGNDLFRAYYTGDGTTNAWQLRNGSSIVFDGVLPTPTTRPRFIGSSGTDTLYVYGTSGNDSLVVAEKFASVNGFELIAQSINSWGVYGQNGADSIQIASDNLSGFIDGGGSSANTLIGPDRDSTWVINNTNRGTLNEDISFLNIPSLVGGSGDDTFRFTLSTSSTVRLTGSLDGGDGRDTLDYSGYSGSVFTSWRTNQASKVGSSTSSTGTPGAATNFEAVVGRGVSSDRVEGPDSVNQWRITGENAGNINNGQYAFSGIGSVTGGPQEDLFYIEDNGSLAGSISGSSNDHIVMQDRPTPIDVNITDRRVDGILGSFSVGQFYIEGDNVNRMVGSTGSITLNLMDQNTFVANGTEYVDGFNQFVGGENTNEIISGYFLTTATNWNITGNNTGYVTFGSSGEHRLDFSAVEQLSGSNQSDVSDTFTVQQAASWTGNLSGNLGSDTFQVSGELIGIIYGQSNTSFTVSGTNTLIGPDRDSTWTITSTDRGTLNTDTQFIGIRSLVGGSGDDTFRFTLSTSSTVRLTGSLDGGEGRDTLDYSGYSGSVFTSWRTNQASKVGSSTSSTGTPGAAINFEAVIGRGVSSDRVEGPDSVNQWRITGENAGSINDGQYAFSGIGSVTGGPQEDLFYIEDEGSLSGTIFGSSDERIVMQDRVTPIDVNIANRRIDGVLGGFSNVGTFLIEGDDDNRLVGNGSAFNINLNANGGVTANSVNYTSGFSGFYGANQESIFAPNMVTDWYITDENAGYVLYGGIDLISTTCCAYMVAILMTRSPWKILGSGTDTSTVKVVTTASSSKTVALPRFSTVAAVPIRWSVPMGKTSGLLMVVIKGP